MDELGKHFITHLLSRLREEAYPDGCPDCQDLKGDMRCFGCADTLATVDAIERLTARNELLEAMYEAAEPVSRLKHWTGHTDFMKLQEAVNAVQTRRDS